VTEKADPTFAAIPADRADHATARIAVLPVPYDGTVTWHRGAARGPEAIIEASQHMELFDEALRVTPAALGIATEPPVDVTGEPKDVLERVESRVTDILARGAFPVLLGGEHSVTVGAVHACVRERSEISVLVLDAHADLRNEYEWEPLSHACTVARIREAVSSTVQVGVRSMSSPEAERIRDEGIQVVMAPEARGMRDWDDVLMHLKANVYVSVDVDVFDPSVVPHTGTPEPGGLDWYDVVSLLEAVFGSRNVVGCDVVELSPADGGHASDFTCARLAYRMMGLRFRDELRT
jgi:agmatinase